MRADAFDLLDEHAKVTGITRAREVPVPSPSILRQWATQLADLASLIESQGSDGQIEVRLYANAGRVRKRPMVVLNSGPQPVS